MHKHVAYAMAVAAFATTMSFSGTAFAANSLIVPVDPGLKPAVEEEHCRDEKKSYGPTMFRSFSEGPRTFNRNRNRNND